MAMTMDMVMPPVGDMTVQDLKPIQDLAQPDLSMPDMVPTQWQKVSTPSNQPPFNAITGVTGATPTIWIVGNSGAVLTGNGTTPFVRTATDPANVTLTAVWAASALEVWVTDNGGKVYKTIDAGATWMNTNCPATKALYAISGRSNTDITVGGNDTGNIDYYASAGWQTGAARPTNQLGKMVFGIFAGMTNWYLVGEMGRTARGTTVSTLANINIPAAPNLRAVYGTNNENAVWLVGDMGFVASYDSANTKWNQVTTAATANLNGLWLKDATNVWFVGDSGTVYSNAGSANFVSKTNANIGTTNLAGIWGDGSGGVWAIGSPGGKGAVYKY